MLTTLRNSSKNSILKIIFVVINSSYYQFCMWGIEDLVGVGKKQSTVATVENSIYQPKNLFTIF